MTRLHAHHANVVMLRPSLGETCRDALATAASHFNDAVAEVDRVLSRAGDHIDETVRAWLSGDPGRQARVPPAASA